MRRLLPLGLLATLACDCGDPIAGGGRDAGRATRHDAGTLARDGGSAELPDAAVGDAGVVDGGGDVDAGARDAGGADPTSCPVGPADGCCPIDIVHGGRDPDCPALDCATPTVGPAIPLHGPEEPAQKSGTGIAWDGHALGLVSYWFDGSDQTVSYHRRTRTGTVSLPPTLTPFRESLRGVGHVAALTRMASGRLVATTASRGRWHHWFVDPSTGITTDTRETTGRWGGQLSWGGDRDLLAVGESLFSVGIDNDGSSTHTFSFWRYRPDAPPPNDMRRSNHAVEGVQYSAKAARHAPTGRVFVLHAERLLMGIFIDAETMEVVSTTPIHSASRNNLEATDAAFDGTAYGLVWQERTGFTNYRFEFASWSEDGGMGPRLVLPTLGRVLQPRLIWTGSEFFVVVTTYRPVDNTGPGGYPRTEFAIDLFRIAADGSGATRTRVADPGMHPDLAYVDGRLAITWAGTEATGEGRYLAFVDCE